MQKLEICSLYNLLNNYLLFKFAVFIYLFSNKKLNQ